MNNLKSSKSICFLGNPGRFSASALRTLLDQGVLISQIFCAGIAPAPKPEKTLPLSVTGTHFPANIGTLESLANQHGIPIRYITKQAELSLLSLPSYKIPDFILVACFPYRLPEFLIRWPKLACLNIHPSLLPQYRGPDPLFWQLYNGEFNTGVSLHLVTVDIDEGPVISQRNYPLKDGASRQEIETSLANMGAILFKELLENDTSNNIPAKQQDGINASYYPFPSKSDYEVSLNWSAKHAFNFIRGTCSPSGHYDVRTESHHLKIISTVDYANNGNIPGGVEHSDKELLMQFSPGVLRAKSI